MSDNLKTIKELADELGVSKTAINKKVTDRERKLWFSKIGNKFVINEDGQKSIKRMFEGLIENQESQTENLEQKPNSQTENLEQKPNSQTENFRNNNESNADIKYILDIIEYQKEQIKDLQNTKDEQFKQLSNMQNLLDQQQRLALQDKKLLEEYKAEINDLKALKMPSQETKEEQANIQPQEELETLKEQTRALNDKIKGQEELNNKSSKKWYQFWK
ncbi:OrfX replication associated protein (plasmid) [Lactococcus cremoris subsp. cremoris UC509.9]|uniref:DNA-binding protein n=1 Tax=Lactococcus TaxID=1357 RepID=UPI00029B7CB5|nr:DNA-binding protein [Lactococcus cremoris]AFW92706.1 OrfX replication associated protein [Lactococcus cremoris subsp. cremoris UC509.9]UXV59862.1 DNA-binding protein [Lactococcus cremoris]